jgi:hypothetical protein
LGDSHCIHFALGSDLPGNVMSVQLRDFLDFQSLRDDITLARR